MLPNPVRFSSMVRKMGIGDGMKIVVYDTYGFYCAAARVWWMFRTMGARDVVVLNGGMPKWLDEDRPTEEGWPLPRMERHFTARMDRTLLCELDDMTHIVETGAAQIIDARSETRFTGEIGEPREGLKKGHIPGSINIFFKDFLKFDGAFKPYSELKTLLAKTNLNLDRPMVTTCGSGVTAAVMNLLLAELGHEEVPLYDGSWAEWGRLDSSLPFEQDVD
jgi:thiosulfate/3-mercaptopyruvate sulfurtransferase